ncbi:hypothetical protein RINTHH_13310 [Richelia intracellularis HH01]|uniref:Uncharacterized protein n=1 Tax=Richelia intracellularis HH01 TaxID=1165094 RepID=M1X5M8_9NOST|nr:hypothetical protein [Richelia intracellularis]CCH67486.1 hypothetical protein RINTHH_13310 [Richelia intracellularis HH01]HAE06629.1 hypothetical protein [Richelia sp.]
MAGILEIWEMVTEIIRKVKRLAVSSQEISIIVALISQIASRINLLALRSLRLPEGKAVKVLVL